MVLDCGCCNPSCQVIIAYSSSLLIGYAAGLPARFLLHTVQWFVNFFF